MFSVNDLDLTKLVWRWVTLWWGPGSSCQWNWGLELWAPSLMVSQYLVSLIERTSTLYHQVESWIKFRKKISKFSIVFWFTFNVYINYLPFGFNIKIFFYVCEWRLSDVFVRAMCWYLDAWFQVFSVHWRKLTKWPRVSTFQKVWTHLL